MDRQLINYLPPILREIREYKAIMDSEQVEVVKLWDEHRNVLDNGFITTASEYGIQRFEKLLNILPKSTDTLEDRRFRILTRFNEQLPYTFRTLDKRLEDLCGEDGYTLELFNGIYALKVRIELIVKSQFDSVNELLERIVPANMVIDLSLRYNQHSTLANFTHAQLSAYTYEQIRNEVIS